MELVARRRTAAQALFTRAAGVEVGMAARLVAARVVAGQVATAQQEQQDRPTWVAAVAAGVIMATQHTLTAVMEEKALSLFVTLTLIQT